MIPENLLLAKLPPEEWERLRPHVTDVQMNLHDILVKPYETIRDVWFPIDLLASLVTVLEDGSTVEAGSVGREGMVGVPVLLDAQTTPMQTVVQVPGRAYRVSADVVKKLYDERGFFHTMMNRYTHTLFVIAAQSTACNRKHEIEARLARWLLVSSDGVGSSEVAITHEYLAAMLGVRRPGVTEAALKLQQAGTIDYRRGGVTILHREALEKAACECYARMRDEMARLLG
ncbi:MAG TPA: Crp/Fnr family transcriptional regulator [Thermoanaerobaculia bacterium]|nr:Crp/Fnr family transcriptional regulator [Thermoanaerobaculia bacterium]